jgi:hypothetical protein
MRVTFTEKDLIDHFLSALQEAPDTTANIASTEVGSSNGRADALIEAQIGGESVLLLVEAKRSAFPRDVREAVWQLRNYLTHHSPAARQIVPMVIAESISPGARSLLRQEHRILRHRRQSLCARPRRLSVRRQTDSEKARPIIERAIRRSARPGAASDVGRS